jgi:hypothetical protein
MQKERARYEALLARASASSERLEQLQAPIAKAGIDVDSLATRLQELEPQLTQLNQVSSRFQKLDDQAAGLTETRKQALEEIARSREEVQGILELGSTDVRVRVVVLVQPGSHLPAERELRRRLLDAFAAAGIDLPAATHALVVPRGASGASPGVVKGAE